MIRANIGNSIANIFDLLKSSIFASITTGYMKLILNLKAIKFGKSIRFYGVTKFKRSNNGNIVIGDNCIFRSKSTSNLIGINRPCILTALIPGSNLVIGNHCGFSGTVIGCFKKIEIGNDVMCGANTLITDSDWHPEDPRVGEAAPIFIMDNVWLGVGVTVLKGVTIGSNSIIGANSMVTRDIPSNVIAAGNPCRVIKQL
jgi:acetyltransferase-like isoleucine patch superfamily enzyme